jgi:hypothetical protein
VESVAARQRVLDDEAYHCRQRANEFRQGQDMLYFNPELFVHFSADCEMALFHQRVGQRVAITRTPTDCITLARGLPKTKPVWLNSRRPPLLQLALIFIASAYATPNARFSIATQKFGKATHPPIEACRKTLNLFHVAAPIEKVRNLQAQLSVHSGLQHLLTRPDSLLIAAIAAAGATALLPSTHPLDARPQVPRFRFYNVNTEEITHAAGRRTTQPVPRSEAIVSADQRVDRNYSGTESDADGDRARTVN